MPLNVAKINSLKPKDKDYKLSDEKGLYLLVKKNSSKYWRFKYRINGVEKLLSLGVYPDVSLKEARDDRDLARRQVRDGVDPSLMRKLEKAGSKENTFQAIAEEFLISNSHKWSKSHQLHIKQCFERDVFPWIGSRPLKELTALEVLTTLRRVVDRGALETVRAGDVLVITRLDRLARSTLHLCQIAETLKDKGVDLQVLDQSINTADATGRLLFNMLGAIGQFETEIRAERQMEGIYKAKQRGVSFGRQKKLSDDDVQQLKEKRGQGVLIKNLMKEYGLSKASIYRYLS